MNINFPKKQYTINILKRHAEYLDRISEEMKMTPSQVIMLALTWHQLVMETPGAREAVEALMPQLPSKMPPPMPTKEELEQAIERQGK